MPPAAMRGKVTILWLMVATASLAVVFRGLMETPRVVRHSLWDGIAAMYTRRAEEAEARFEPVSAASNRESAERYARIAQPFRPDPFGHACYVISVYGVPFGLVAASATYWARRRSRRSRDSIC